MNKKRIRLIVGDILEHKCGPCEKKKEFSDDGTNTALNDHCRLHCPSGRDLKKLGEILDIETDRKEVPEDSEPKRGRKPKIKVREEKKMTVVAEKKELTKEILEELKTQGRKNNDIMIEYGLNSNQFYDLQKQWGLSNRQKKQQEPTVKDFIKEMADQPAVIHQMPEIEIFPLDEYESLKTEINSLRQEAEAIRIENEQLRNRPQPEPFNRELYQELADLKEQYRTTMNLLAQSGKDYQELKAKYEASTTFIKAVL